MSKEKEMHKTGWANIELPPHLKKAREEQEKLKEEKLRMRESSRRGNDANYSDNSEEVTKQLEALDVENSSKN